ncbi:hypothetical protein V7124_19730 [Neobacillus niacini]|uniref:hypothetical protein n=1 Tax=Neobacillus niacini TaxID=86668 RepID=UPI002FFF535D
MDEKMLGLITLVGELSGEIQKMKVEMEEIKKEISKMKEVKTMNSALKVDSDEEITLTVARDYVMEQISKRYPELELTKGSQKLGTKLTISNGKKTLRVLVKKSKSHRIKEDYPSGWFTVHEEATDAFDLYVFVITFKDEIHTILLSPTQFKKWVEAKHITSDNIHFYMNQIEGKWIDDRDDINYQFTDYAENWSVIEEILEGKDV